MTALEAHAKLLASLPVRTHRWQPAASPTLGRPRAEQTRLLHQAIIRLTTQGLTRHETAKKLGVELQTVRRHCRDCKWE